MLLLLETNQLFNKKLIGVQNFKDNKFKNKHEKNIMHDKI